MNVSFYLQFKGLCVEIMILGHNTQYSIILDKRKEGFALI